MTAAMKRSAALLCALIFSLTLFAGCSSTEEAPYLGITCIAKYVGLDSQDAVSAELGARLPAYDGEIQYKYMSSGDSTSDAMMTAGTMMKLTAMFASQEVDILFADEENAARNARSNSFLSLSELLTEEEIEALGSRALSCDMLDDQGNPTGEKTPVCGVDLSGCAVLTPVLGTQSIGVYVVSNTDDLEYVKTALREILSW